MLELSSSILLHLMLGRRSRNLSLALALYPSFALAPNLALVRLSPVSLLFADHHLAAEYPAHVAVLRVSVLLLLLPLPRERSQRRLFVVCYDVRRDTGVDMYLTHPATSAILPAKSLRMRYVTDLEKEAPLEAFEK